MVMGIDGLLHDVHCDVEVKMYGGKLMAYVCVLWAIYDFGRWAMYDG